MRISLGLKLGLSLSLAIMIISAAYVSNAVLLDARRVEAQVLSSMFTDMTRFAVVLAVVALLVTVLLWKLVVRPLRELRAVISNRAAGDSTARVAPPGGGELATLGRAFNVMLDQIEQEQERVRSTAAKLRSSERLLDMALGGASMGLWSLDLGNGELQVDDRWLALCGQQDRVAPLDEAGEEALVHPQDLPRLRAARAAHVNADDGAYECELRVTDGDGGWRWVLDRGRVVERSDDGEPLRMAGTRQDVNERKCAQQAVADSERLLSTVLDNMPMPVFLKHRDGRFLLVNDYYLRCYDVHREGILDHTALHAHVAPYAQQYMCEDAEVLRSGRALRWDSRERVADGSIRDFSVTKFPVFDANGEIIAIGGVTIDETDRLMAMAGIRASEQRLRSLTANLPGAVYRATAGSDTQTCDWRIDYASEGIESVLGVRRAELVDTSRSLHALLHEDDSERVLANLRASAARQSDFDIEYRLWVTPQDMRWVNDRGRFGRDSAGGAVTIDGLLLDITARKQAERELCEARDGALEAVRAKADFLANMSHELHTPLNGVLGMLDLLHETTLEADQAECVDVARRSGEALMELIAEVLDFSGMDYGQLPAENVEFDLWECVDDVLRLVAERAQQHRVELVARYSPSVPRFVRGDARWLRQVLGNLVGNAVKFTRDGDVEISVARADDGDDARERLLFDVRDSGIGIDTRHHQSIFSAFVQADSSTTRPHGGTGLGLAICRGLVERMGGSIGVESAPGKGSRFHFDACFTSVVTGSSPARLAPDLGGCAVLLAVHHRPRAEALAQVVAVSGARAEICEPKDELVNLLDTARQDGRPFDLLLIDVQRAGGADLAQLRRLRTGARGRRTDVVLLTALGERLDETALTGAGVVAAISEPVRTAKLVDCLARLLGRELPEETGSEAAQDDETPLQFAQVRVLVAEDAPVNQKVATAMLARLGVRPELVSDGAAALQALDERVFDLVLMDCRMPVVDGWETTRRRRATELAGGLARTPIIALTASSVAGDRDRCLAAGMDGHLARPLTIKALRECLRDWLPRATTKPVADDVLDERPLDELCGTLGEQTVHEIIDAFLLGVEVFEPELRDCIQRDDPSGAAACLHRMVGSAAVVGATRLTDVCRAHERRLTSAEPASPVVCAGIDLVVIGELLQATRVAVRKRFPDTLAATG